MSRNQKMLQVLLVVGKLQLGIAREIASFWSKTSRLCFVCVIFSGQYAVSMVSRHSVTQHAVQLSCSGKILASKRGCHPYRTSFLLTMNSLFQDANLILLWDRRPVHNWSNLNSSVHISNLNLAVIRYIYVTFIQRHRILEPLSQQLGQHWTPQDFQWLLILQPTHAFCSAHELGIHTDQSVGCKRKVRFAR